ncbi:flagellar basal body rod C-terminal domain-containing protein [Alishewanella longhuensis]
MTLDGVIGKDLINLPSFTGLNYRENTGIATLNVRLEPGKGEQLPPNDFLVTITGPNQVTVQALDTRGQPIPDSEKVIDPVDLSSPLTLNSSDDADGDLYGLEITLSPGAAVGDRFLLKPLQQAARELQMATNRGEDIALAGPLRATFDPSNLGNSRIESIKISNTDPASSGFSASQGLDNGPFSVIYQGVNVGGDHVFRILDKDSNLVGDAEFNTNNFNNVLSKIPATPPAIPPATMATELGFDFSISGVPKAGDSFTIEFNTNGFNDNRNGLELAALQNAETTRRNAVVVENGVNQYSFNQSYATTVGNIGERTRQARTSEEANAAILEQTTVWFESLSGVSLDEEAANLVRFQQTYAAAARILSTSQTIFDTLLQAVR